MAAGICKICFLARTQRFYLLTNKICAVTKQSKTRLLAQTKRLLRTSQERSESWRRISQRGLAYSLVPAGTSVMSTQSNFNQGSGFTHHWPPWIKALCQEAATIESQLPKRKSAKKRLRDLIQILYAGLLLFIQCVKVCAMFCPLLCLYPLTHLSGRLYSAWLRALFWAVQRCGPVFIKLGQWASTRRDLFSGQFCEQFSLLHSAVPAHDWRHTEQAFLQAYGKRWQEVIKIDKSRQPLGSGCAAQVYKGYIHVSNLPSETLEEMEDSDAMDDVYFKDGLEIHSLMESFDESHGHGWSHDASSADAGDVLPYEEDRNYIAVAIKVVHPDVRWQLSRDLFLMRTMARVLETLVPSLRWVNLAQCVQQFSLSLTKQMDMVHEARCLKRFHADFTNMHCIRIPVPVMSLVRQNILVESFEEGEPIGNFIASKEDDCPGLKKKMADMGIDALLQMVFVKNFVHGDLHPGNILVQNADAFTQQTEDSLVMVDVGDVLLTTVSPRECPLRLVLLDCGITASLDQEDRAKFTQVFSAVVRGQGEVVADLFLEKSQHMECKDPEAFRRDMAQLVNAARQTTLKLAKLKVSALLSEVFAVLSRHHIQLESNFATVILAMGIVEGLGRSLDPHLDILTKASTLLLGEAFRAGHPH